MWGSQCVHTSYVVHKLHRLGTLLRQSYICLDWNFVELEQFAEPGLSSVLQRSLLLVTPAQHPSGNSGCWEGQCWSVLAILFLPAAAVWIGWCFQRVRNSFIKFAYSMYVSLLLPGSKAVSSLPAQLLFISEAAIYLIVFATICLKNDGGATATAFIPIQSHMSGSVVHTLYCIFSAS